MTVSSGTRLNGRYEVREQLGRGGMGVVWRGRDVLLRRDVAIKVMKDADPDRESYARFVREAQVGAGLQHPGIVAVHDIGRASDDIFIVMELLSGSDLQELLNTVRAGLPAGQVVDLMIQAADALAVAHHRGVIHRDLKPLNLFLVNGERLKVCDFGLARVADRSRLTEPDRTFGTAAYMAPEQFLSAAVDGRADLYSLGCVMYALLTGRPPFPADQSWVALATQHARVVPEPPRGEHPIPRQLSDLVLRLLAKRPDDRPATADAVATELRTIGLVARPDHRRREPPPGRATPTGPQSPDGATEDQDWWTRMLSELPTDERETAWAEAQQALKEQPDAYQKARAQVLQQLSEVPPNRRLLRFLRHLPPEDLAGLLAELAADQAALVLEDIGPAIAAAVMFAAVEGFRPDRILAYLEPRKAAWVLEQMDPQGAGLLLLRLGDLRIFHVIKVMDREAFRVIYEEMDDAGQRRLRAAVKQA